MGVLIGRGARLAGLAVLGVLPLGCSAQHECSLIGAESGVVVNFDRGVVPADTPIALEVCVNQKCRTHMYDRVGPTVALSMSSMPQNVDVRISVLVSKGSRPIFSGSTTARTRKFQPNGPGCDPTVWDAGVKAHTNGHLTAA